LQRDAALSPGGVHNATLQQQADWKAEQIKVVAAVMQHQADHSRDQLLHAQGKTKKKAAKKAKKKAEKKKVQLILSILMMKWKVMNLKWNWIW
jgi:malate/lactate dehydrogenase